MKWKQPLARFILFGLLGMLLEVFFTATFELIDGNMNMHGRTSPWMLPIYGLLGIVLVPVARPLINRGVPLPVRAFIYMLGIFLVEYVTGIIYTAFGLVIWDYSDLPLNVHGQITLLYAPFWFVLGLVVETLYRYVDTCAWVILHRPKRSLLDSV